MSAVLPAAVSAAASSAAASASSNSSLPSVPQQGKGQGKVWTLWQWKIWPINVFNLFNKIFQEESFISFQKETFESFDDFKNEIEEIYRGMTRALQKTHPSCDLLRARRDLIDQNLSELYQRIVFKNYTPEKTISCLLQSPIFQALIPETPQALKEGNEENYEFLKAAWATGRLSLFPTIQFCPEVVEWFTLASLVSIPRSDQDILRETMNALPPEILLNVYSTKDETILSQLSRHELQLLINILKFSETMARQLSKSDLQLLIDITKNDKVVAVWEQITSLCPLLKDGEKDYNSIYRTHLLTGLQLLLVQLPDDKEKQNS